MEGIYSHPLPDPFPHFPSLHAHSIDIDAYDVSEGGSEAAWEMRVSFCVSALHRLILTHRIHPSHVSPAMWNAWCRSVDDSVLLEGRILRSASPRHMHQVSQWQTLVHSMGPMMRGECVWKEGQRVSVAMRLFLVSRVILPTPSFLSLRNTHLDAWISSFSTPSKRQDEDDDEDEDGQGAAAADAGQSLSFSVFPRRLIRTCKTTSISQPCNSHVPANDVMEMEGVWGDVLWLLCQRIYHQGVSLSPLPLFTLTFVALRWMWYFRIISQRDEGRSSTPSSTEGHIQKRVSESLLALSSALASASSSDPPQRTMRQKLAERLCLEWIPLLPAHHPLPAFNPSLPPHLPVSAFPSSSPSRGSSTDTESLFDHVMPESKADVPFPQNKLLNSLSSPRSRQRPNRSASSPSSAASPRSVLDSSRKRSRILETMTPDDAESLFGSGDDEADLVVPAKRRRIVPQSPEPLQQNLPLSLVYIKFQSFDSVASSLQSELEEHRVDIRGFPRDAYIAACSFLRCAPVAACANVLNAPQRNLFETLGVHTWALALRRCIATPDGLAEQLLLRLVDKFEELENFKKISMIRSLRNCCIQQARLVWPPDVLSRMRSICAHARRASFSSQFKVDVVMAALDLYWIISRVDGHECSREEDEASSSSLQLTRSQVSSCLASIPFTALCQQRAVLDRYDTLEVEAPRFGLLVASNSQATPVVDHQDDAEASDDFHDDEMGGSDVEQLDHLDHDNVAESNAEPHQQQLGEDYDDLDDFITWGGAL
jgi:hypothetical protein